MAHSDADRRNETRKLHANLMNNISAAILVIGFVAPFFNGLFDAGGLNLIVRSGASIQTGYIIGVLTASSVFHMLGRLELEELE